MDVPTAVAVDRALVARAALVSADEVGLLDHLAAASVRPERLAAELGLDPRMVARTVDALAGLGVVKVVDGAARLVEDARAILRAGRQRYDRLTEALRGQPMADRVDATAGANAFYPTCAPALGAAFRRAADAFAPHLARPGARVLDVGAGAAPWSLALCRHEPSVRVVALDLPRVLPATRRAVRRAGWSEAYSFVPGDVFDRALDQLEDPRFDVVLAGNLLHLFAPDRAAELVGMLAAHVGPGGLLGIVDVPADGVAEDPALALYALGLALRTASGGLHWRADQVSWMGSAGLRPAGVVRNRAVPSLVLLLGARTQ